MYMNLCLLLTLTYLKSAEEFTINEKIYITNGTAFVNVSCGDVPYSAVAVEWFRHKEDQWVKMLKFYKTGHFKYYKNYSNHTYEPVNTYLIIKNIEHSNSSLFQCNSVGGSNYSYTTMLQVIGKLFLKYLLL